MKKESRAIHINFLAKVNNETVNKLIGVVDEGFKQGVRKFVILMSSSGGWVAPGLTAFNYLKGLPVEITTHNYGIVHSIAVPLFCAGSKRLSSPEAQFFIHGVYFQGKGPFSFDERALRERLDSLKGDRDNIAAVIAKTCGKTKEKVAGDMLRGITLNAQQAKEYGLVNETRQVLMKKTAKVIPITEKQE